MVATLLILAAQLSGPDPLARDEQADEKVCPMSAVVGKILKKMAGAGAEEHFGKETAAAARRALQGARDELAKGTPYREAFERAIGALDAAALKRLRKDRDLRLLADSRLRVLRWQHEYCHTEGDIAKSRQQQRAIVAVQRVLWPMK